MTRRFRVVKAGSYDRDCVACGRACFAKESVTYPEFRRKHAGPRKFFSGRKFYCGFDLYSCDVDLDRGNQVGDGVFETDVTTEIGLPVHSDYKQILIPATLG